MATLWPLSLLGAGPVSLDAMRTYLRVDGRDDDEMIAAVLASARQHIERRTRRLLCPQIWRMSLDAWPPNGRIRIPLIPFRRVAALRVFDADGVTINLPLSRLTAVTGSEPAVVTIMERLTPGPDEGGIELDVEAGYGVASDVPAALTLAIMRFAALLYERRGDEATELHDAALDALLAPYHGVRLT